MSMGADSGTAIRRRAERLLAAVFGGPTRLGHGVPLHGRANVLRVPVLQAPSGAPATVVLKRTVGPPGDAATVSGTPARLLRQEWAGLALLGRLAIDAPVAPRLYGGDRAAGFLLLEDLGEDTLERVLAGGDPRRAAAALVGLATTLGTMHARTIGTGAASARERAALGATAQDRDTPRYQHLAATFREMAAAVDAPLSPAAEADLARVVAALARPGPFLAYTHGDPAPGNYLITPAGVRAIDFELGRYRHALIEGVHTGAHVPGCWWEERPPTAVVVRQERAYRLALEGGCPEATDIVQFRGAAVVGLAFWSLATCRAWPAIRATTLPAFRAAEATVLRHRLLAQHTILAERCAAWGRCEALGAAAATIVARLAAQWALGARPMPRYPAFR